MVTRKLVAIMFASSNFLWTACPSLAQQLDILNEAPAFDHLSGPLGGKTGQAVILTDPKVLLESLQTQKDVNVDELATKVLGDNTTLNREQLKARLDEFLKPAMGPVLSGPIVILSQPQETQGVGGLTFDFPGAGLGLGNSSAAETASIAPDVVALVNRTDGPFEFRLTINGTSKHSRLQPKEFRTFECATDCAEGVLVEFETLLAGKKGELNMKGGAIYSVNFSDENGWNVLKAEKISYLLSP